MTNGSQQLIDRVRELHYRGLNQEVLKLTDTTTPDGMVPTEWAASQIIRVAALYELHLPQQALATLQNIVEKNCGSEDQILYYRARIEYQLSNYDSVLNYAKQIIAKAHTLRDKFRGLLLVGNVHYSKGDLDLIPELMEELRPMATQLPDDDRISLIMLRANYERTKGGSLLAASKESYCEAAALASSRSWSHFTNRAFYGLALSLKSEGNESELRATLRILRSLVVPSESLFLTHLINTDFQDVNFSIATPIEFDVTRMRVMVNGKALQLHEKPLIFSFLHAMHGLDKFLTKEEISERLWPTERYNPMVHDARIFDVAKRARGVIETFDQQPVVLLSGRLGYKLASK